MVSAVAIALAGGILVSLSRQLNGRLSLNTSALESSFWNHVVGLAVLVLAALIWGGLLTPGWQEAPLWAYVGGPVGVVFIAASSWLITRIGAVRTAALIIAGQMVFGVILDLIMGAPGSNLARVTGVALILAGMLVAGRAKR